MAWHLHEDGKRFIAKGDTYPIKETLKSLGMRWDPNDRVWATPIGNIRAISVLWQFAKDPDLRARLQAAQSITAASLDMSRAADANIEIPAREGQSYMPFQKAGVAYAMHRPGTLIADEMGLGKTVQGCGVINAEDARRVLIVCPASLRLVWKRHASAWLVRRLPVFMANGRKDKQFAHAVASGCDGIFILNYDILMDYVGLRKQNADAIAAIEDPGLRAAALKAAKWDRKGADGPLVKAKWDVVIGDEVHYVKNRKAQRSAAFSCLDGTRRLGLTGTPIVNRPRELFGIINWISPSEWGYKMFREHYDTDGCSSPKEHGEPCWRCRSCDKLRALQRHLRETIMVRRLKRDVLTELPAKRRQIIEIEATGAAADMVARQMLQWSSHAAVIAKAEAAAKAAQEAHDEQAYRKAVALLNSQHSVAFQEMSRERHDIGVAKTPYAIEHVDAMREAGVNKIVVFAYHHAVVDALRNHYGKACVVVDGRVAKDARQAAVDAFQKRDDVEIFIGQINSAGVGLTLTAASHVVFVELDWVPGNMTQAEDRCHRIGQSDSVLVQHLVFAESMDSKMAQTLVEKQRVIEQSLDKTTAEPLPPVAPVIDLPAPVESFDVPAPVAVQSDDDYMNTSELPF